VNKAELIEAIAAHADISKAAAGRALEATISSIQLSLEKGEAVTLVGFGTFSVARRAARTARNPRTGKTLEVKASRVPKFRPGKALRDAMG
jgi:DNA-binding protein HU-beta